MTDQKIILSIVEMGGYPDFAPLFRSLGYQPGKLHAIRKAQSWLKKNKPAVVVSEFHFDPELRDRMSNLESLMATLQRYAPDAKVIVFIDKNHRDRLEKVQARYNVFGALGYPIDEESLKALLQKAAE
ncbi:hypothetical protein [Solemya velesiana gill symbiont]|uniref:Response regulatory domain-containing protein n=1 Tax=Solemya velesiana gill symbiont TaxID=1918948 RepID=A0A1T2KXE7_9GAMM|nr:hypothetical protein [Solemya velesiana gill symbiont]OOZ37484.1 hypothetical protein BOW51_02195 [Solemya velesiana gill symbiont]